MGIDDGELLAEYIPTGVSNVKNVEEQKEKICKPFATLPYINGQKYTIGDRYTSRVEQGEFIFLSRDLIDKQSEKGDPLCQINCAKNDYWILPRGGNRIFINGVKVSARTKTRLKFGDKLTFEKDEKEQHDVSNIVKEDLVRILFKKFEPSSNVKKDDYSATSSGLAINSKTTGISEAVFWALQNELILSNILSYFSNKDLKNARFVSQLWNKEAFKILRERSVFNANVTSLFFPYDANVTMRLFLYDLEMTNNLLDHWKIRLKSVEYRFSPTQGSPGAKYIDDLFWILSKHRNVTSLKLGGPINHQFDYDLQIKILQLVQNTLQNLAVNLSTSSDDKLDIKNSFPTPLKFHKLQAFKLKMVGYFPPNKIVQIVNSPLVPQIIQAVAGASKIKIKSPTPFTLLFLKSLTSFPNLNDISFYWTDLAGWEQLLKFDKPLKRLKVFSFGDTDAEDDDELADQVEREMGERVKMFEKVLQKFSQTLEVLEFGVEDVTENMIIHIPAMPRLKVVKTFFWSYSGPPLTLKFVFGGPFDYGTLNYEQHFPVLQSLTVNRPTDSDSFIKRFELFIQNFFPLCAEDGLQQVCKSVRRLEVATYSRACRKGIGVPRAAEIAKMFPNVSNDWLNPVRESSGNHL